MPKMKKEERLLLEQNVDYKTLKEELSNYVREEIKKGFVNEIDKSNKRLIKEKNRKILARDVVIILLLLFSGYLMYILYHNNYFDKFFNKNSTTIKENVSNKEETKEETKKPTLEELVASYGYLLDNIKINSNSSYLKDYYEGNITTELSNELALNTIKLNTLTVEDDYNIIEEEKIKTAFENIFSKNHKYTAKNFNSNGNTVRYISKLESYITTEILTEKENNIKREIIGVIQESNNIKITTVEGIVKDNVVYNILTNENVGTYTENKLKNYENKLNKVTYTFDKEKKLISITK